MMNKKRLAIIRDMEAVMKKHLGQDVAMGVCFTLPAENWSRCHWITNISRADGIRLFEGAATDMKAQTN